MAVLERSELEASPLADLHAIADQIGLEGYRRLRKADLIDAILGHAGGADGAGARADAGEVAAGRADAGEVAAGRGDAGEVAAGRGDAEAAAGESGEEERPARTRRRRSRTRRSAAGAEGAEAGEAAGAGAGEAAGGETPHGEVPGGETPHGEAPGGEEAAGQPRAAAAQRRRAADGGRVAQGVVEVLGNGSAFLRVDPHEPSDEDVYISAAQVRRCELVSGDRVSGPVRAPRRSERYPSLVKVDTINEQSADAVTDGARYEDLPVAWPSERLTLGAGDATLEAIEWLTPIGRGSRAVIVGPPRSGKTDTLRRLLEALSGREGLEVSVVLAGARPEEIEDWREAPVAPAAAVSFAGSPDVQSAAVERTIDAARRVAARGADALVLIDGLDGLHPAAARKALAAARNLRDGGSLTVIATARAPLGGETTVIALDPAGTAAGGRPVLDLVASGTLRLELLVGEDGASAVAKARADAIAG